MKTIRISVLVVLLLSIVTHNILAQVTIGSLLAPRSGALLDMREYEDKTDGSNATRGLLLPRVKLSSYSNLEDLGVTGTDLSKQEGMIVFHSAEDNCAYIPKGIYVWSGTKWSSLEGKSHTVVSTSKQGIEQPNSYIVSGGASIVQIPLAKAFKIWDQTAFKDDNNENLINKVTLSNLTAEVIWMDNKDLICSLNLPPVAEINESSILEVQVGKVHGNAIVALQMGTNTVWSWHIWSTEEVGEQTANGYVWMDRNMGATLNTENSAESRGVLYQWGRKDPFPNTLSSGITEPNLFDISGSNVVIDKKAVVATMATNIEFAINNPATYITTTASPYYDWSSSATSISPWLNRWDNSGVKAPMDPCPEGWKVPSQKGDGSSPWKGIAVGVVNDFKEGWNWPVFGYYPLTGSRIGADGQLSGKDSGGHYWTSGASIGFPKAMYLSKSIVFDEAQGYMGEAFAVRCVKE